MKHQISRFKLLYFYFLMILLMSCQPSLKHLEEALAIAGNNRSELEKILKHYQQNERDPLKLKAAIFLIENMPGHKSLGGPYIDKYYKEWIPIHWAKIKKGKALFSNMGKEIVYMPVYYTKEGVKPMSHPFLLDHKGKVQWLNADTIHTQTLCLNRKYPPSADTFFSGERMIGGKLQVSNYEDFKDSLTLYQISDWCSSGRFTNIPDSAWRYWRYLSPEVGLCNISELAFFKKDSIQPTKGKIIGTEASCYCDPNHLKETVFDGDPLTFFDAPTWGGAWVGMDFGEKVKLGKIIYIPRTDGIMKDVKEDVINYLLMCYICES